MARSKRWADVLSSDETFNPVICSNKCKAFFGSSIQPNNYNALSLFHACARRMPDIGFVGVFRSASKTSCLLAVMSLDCVL